MQPVPASAHCYVLGTGPGPGFTSLSGKWVCTPGSLGHWEQVRLTGSQTENFA